VCGVCVCVRRVRVLYVVCDVDVCVMCVCVVVCWFGVCVMCV